MANIMQIVILLPIALILLGALGGVAIGQIFTVNQTGWDTGTITMWNLIPLIAVVGIFIGILAVAGLKVAGKIQFSKTLRIGEGFPDDPRFLFLLRTFSFSYLHFFKKVQFFRSLYMWMCNKAVIYVTYRMCKVFQNRYQANENIFRLRKEKYQKRKLFTQYLKLIFHFVIEKWLFLELFSTKPASSLIVFKTIMIR